MPTTRVKTVVGPRISLKALQWRVGELKKEVRAFREQALNDSDGSVTSIALQGYLKALDDVLKLARKMPKEGGKE